MLDGKKRGLVALGVVLAVAVAGIIASGWIIQGPPDPKTASREAILRWLVVADVAGQPIEMQLALVERLEQELYDGFDAPVAATLSATHQKTLARNITDLKQLWFMNRVQQYDELPAIERKRFMDKRVQIVLNWSRLESQLQPAHQQADAVASFFDEIERWIVEQHDSQLRTKMTTTVHDGVVRWLATHSLEEQSMDVRSELAQRITEQLEGGLELSGLQTENEAEEELLRLNCELLMEAWLREQAREYNRLPQQRRAEFVGHQIDKVSEWGLLKLFASGADQQSEAAGALRLLSLCEQWIRRAPESERGQLRQLLAAVQMQLFKRMLNSTG